MSELFDTFVKNNLDRIDYVADLLQEFKINASKIEISNAKLRVIDWLRNFENIGYTDFEIPLHLLNCIEFLKTDDISDKIIKSAENLINKETSYITHLGETNESSFIITAKLHNHKHFYLSLPNLLDILPVEKETSILFFDDFLNSGGQLISIFYALCNVPLKKGEINDEYELRYKLSENQIDKLKLVNIHLIYYISFDEGIAKVEKRLKNELGLKIKIHRYHPTNKNESVFGDRSEQMKIEEGAFGKIRQRSIFNRKEYSKLKDFYIIMKSIGEKLLRKNETEWDENKYSERALGYGNLSRLIITDNNVPSITLTAIWQYGTIEYNKKVIEWKELVPRRKKVLSNKYVNMKSQKDNIDYDSLSDELQKLYENDEFQEGLKKAEEYYNNYGSNIKLLKHVLRFNLRYKNWVRVEDIITKLYRHFPDDEQKALCMFTLFECNLRKAYGSRARNEIYAESINKLRKYLNDVPAQHQTRQEYYYFLGRWFLEMWWAQHTSNNFSNLTFALSHFNNAQKIRYTWWVHCYICLVLKLLKRDDFKTEARSFRERIFKVYQGKPNQPSVILYFIIALILNEELDSLKTFLSNFKQAITPTDFEESVIFKIDMIFRNNLNKKNKYTNLISKWIISLQRK